VSTIGDDPVLQQQSNIPQAHVYYIL